MQRYKMDCFDSIVEAKDPADGYLYYCDEVDDEIGKLTTKLQRFSEALYQIVAIADEYDNSPANECVRIADEALTVQNDKN